MRAELSEGLGAKFSKYARWQDDTYYGGPGLNLSKNWELGQVKEHELSEGLGATFIEGTVDKLGKRMRSKLSEGGA